MPVERSVTARAFVVFVAVLASSVPLGAGGVRPSERPTLRNHIGRPATRAALERAAERALLRLEDPECRRIFADFRDAEGRPLQETLDALGETGSSYLTRRMWFADGSGTGSCRWSWTVAVTTPGSAVVFVCARRFRELAFRDPAFVETTLIHEELHSLGLGQNPPSSQEIDAQIARRCGRRQGSPESESLPRARSGGDAPDQPVSVEPGP